MKNYIMLFVVILIIENILLAVILNLHQENINFKLNKGKSLDLIEVCNTINISDDFVVVSEKLNKYYPTVRINNEEIHLSVPYVSEKWVSNTGVAFIFNKDLKLTHKSCNGPWEPELTSFQIKK